MSRVGIVKYSRTIISHTLFLEMLGISNMLNAIMCNGDVVILFGWKKRREKDETIFAWDISLFLFVGLGIKRSNMIKAMPCILNALLSKILTERNT